MKVQPTTKDLIAMLYERAPYLFDVAAQPEPAAWLGCTKLPFREGVPILIFTDKTLADEWLNGFVEGFAWLEPLYRSMKLPAAQEHVAWAKQCASSGLVTDSNGRQIVQLGPRIAGGISLDRDVMASTAKTASLKKRKI